MGCRPNSNELIGAVWVSKGGKQLCWLESLSQASSGTLVYALAEENILHLIVSGVEGELYEKAAMVVVSGLPAPSAWSAEVPGLPLPPPNYPSPCYGFVARIVNNAPAVMDDIPAQAPEANFYRKNINFFHLSPDIRATGINAGYQTATGGVPNQCRHKCRHSWGFCPTV